MVRVVVEEKYHVGLLKSLLPSDQLMPKAMEIATQIAPNDPGVVEGINGVLLQDVGAGWNKMYSNALESQAGRPCPHWKDSTHSLIRKGRRSPLDDN